jgi:VanZ family protein
LRTIPAVSITLLIGMLSLISPDRLPDASALRFPGMDKAVHAAMYAALTFAWAFALPAVRRSRMRTLLAAALAAALYGALMELLQACLTRTRSLEFLDAAANLGGALCAALTLHLLGKLRGRTNARDTPQKT